MTRVFVFALPLFLVSVFGNLPVCRAEEAIRSHSPPDAKVFFIGLTDGARLPSKFLVAFGISGMDVVPAESQKTNSGHHHLLIDTPLPPLDREIPSDPNHLHFGRGQTSVELTLTPGEHTLQLLLGDHHHIPHDPPIMSDVVRVYVEEGAADAATSLEREPSPPDAKVYIISPHDGDVVSPDVTVRFGLINMGVAPAGVSKPNTGHHHLIIDAKTPPLDKPIPNTPNYLHFGGGQTEKKLILEPGPHTLQLILADHRHTPHDPPVISQRIRVTVALSKPAKRQVSKQKRRREALRRRGSG